MIPKSASKKRETVLVVLEGIKASMNEKGTAALQWALCGNIINPNDSIFVLIILNPRDVMASPAVLFCCIGGQQQSLPCKEGEYVKFAHEQISQRRETYLKSLRLHYNRCKNNGVNFEVKVAVGWRPMEIVVEEASKVRATWIVLDRCFAGDLSPVDDYNIALVDDNEEAEVLLNSKQQQSDFAHSNLSVEPILQPTTYILDDEKQRMKETGSSSMTEKPIGEVIDISTKLASIITNDCSWTSPGMKGREEDILEEEKEF
ncbi:hypothetical protein Syun_028763 [Stephania yunnanensis]|uniref:Uncharacterized protein n=1 Tax=Stephania yunnanensis TaxID=152371 RepID=A0AAP0HGR5_9MAGN